MPAVFLRPFCFMALLGAACLTLAAACAMARDSEAARVIALSPGVYVERDGQRTPLALKDPIFTHDTIVTDATGKAQLLFRDDTTVAVGPDSTVNVSRFSFGGADKPAFGMRMGRGMSRVVTGRVVEQNREGFRIATPHATVGIRGTILSPLVTADGTTVVVSQIGAGHSVSVTNTLTGQVSEVGRGGMTVVAAPGGNVVRPSSPAEKARAESAARQTSTAAAPASAPAPVSDSDSAPESAPAVAAASSAPASSASGENAVTETTAAGENWGGQILGTSGGTSASGGTVDRPESLIRVTERMENAVREAVDKVENELSAPPGNTPGPLPPDNGGTGPDPSQLSARYAGNVTGRGSGGVSWAGSFNFDVNLGSGAMDKAGLSLVTPDGKLGIINLHNGSGQMNVSEGGFSVDDFERVGKNVWNAENLKDVEAKLGGQFSGDRLTVNVNELEVSSDTAGKLVDSGSGTGVQTKTWPSSSAHP